MDEIEILDNAFLYTNFSDYTVTEGFLLVFVLIFFMIFCYKLFKGVV